MKQSKNKSEMKNSGSMASSASKEGAFEKSSKFTIIIEDFMESKLKQRAELIVGNGCQISCIRWNGTGTKLAIGLSTGEIRIYNCTQQLQVSCEASVEERHKGKVNEIVWSEDDKFLKSSCLVNGEAFFFRVDVKSAKESLLAKCKASIARDLVWKQLGIFGWECRQLWLEMGSTM